MNEKLKYLTLFVIGMMLSLGMNAQSVKSISGTVTDDQGEAVISGTVKVKNGSTGTITDINGKYTLSAIGYESTGRSSRCRLWYHAQIRLDGFHFHSQR